MIERTRTHPWHYVLLAALFQVLGWFLVAPILLTVRGGFAADPTTGKGFTFEFDKVGTRDASPGTPSRRGLIASA